MLYKGIICAKNNKYTEQQDTAVYFGYTEVLCMYYICMKVCW